MNNENKILFDDKKISVIEFLDHVDKSIGWINDSYTPEQYGNVLILRLQELHEDNLLEGAQISEKCIPHIFMFADEDNFLHIIFTEDVNLVDVSIIVSIAVRYLEHVYIDERGLCAKVVKDTYNELKKTKGEKIPLSLQEMHFPLSSDMCEIYPFFDNTPGVLFDNLNCN